ncbi:phenazine biosynthesis-like domain-containing protein 1 [Panulirus ornatus]|uniref:phenazine biosynthesis-like domain-containing protein 1 n=1 Tax=Panulirus ornatus TaxID=150431 RepID=UPI003A85CFEF
MTRLQIFTVDAFSSRPFSGNPAAVIPLTEPLDEGTMQKVASEMNLSETAFVRPLGGDGGDSPFASSGRFSLRWFTPVKEIPLCGHATLATAHVLFQHLGNKRSQVEFETLSGVLVTRRGEGDGEEEEEGGGITIVMDFPSNPPMALSPAQGRQLQPLVQAVTGDLKVHQVLISHSLKYLLVRLNHSYSREDLEALQPDYSKMGRVHDGSLVMAVIVCVAGGDAEDPRYHVFSRFFAPLYGVDEDPVTGSAHTVLGPYWALQLDRRELTFRQCSKRGGDVKVTVRDDSRVDIMGTGATVLQGYITV